VARGARASNVVDTSLLLICLLSSLVVLFLPGSLRDRAAATLRRTAAAPLAELQRRAEVSRAAFLSYDDRQRNAGAAARAISEAESLHSENAALRRMLGLAQRLGWGFVNAEAMPTQLTGELVQTQILRTFMVTAGGRAGVLPFTPVVTADGLAGMVQAVDQSTSQAISYLHEDFRVSAMTTDASTFGIVQPHLGRGPERGLLELRGVPFRSQLAPGTVVVSSGLGATYPRGIPIGSVLREIQTPEKWARTYLLQPTVPLASIGSVMLLLKARTNAGVDSIWTSVAAADSAARAAAAAGDSIARQTLLREAAARRATFDSLRPDSSAADTTAADPAVTPATASAPPAAAATPAPVLATPPARPPAATPTTSPAPRPSVPRPTTPSAGTSVPPAGAAARPRPGTGTTTPAAGTATPRPTTARDTTERPAARPTVPPPGGVRRR
jgi:rod shape-determining protein MreC